MDKDGVHQGHTLGVGWQHYVGATTRTVGDSGCLPIRSHHRVGERGDFSIPQVVAVIPPAWGQWQ